LAEVFSGRTWTHVDATKLEDRSEFTLDPAEPDLSGVSALVRSVVTAQGDGRNVTGTLDGSTIGDDGYGSQSAQEKPDAAEVEEMPASAYKVMNK
jgi:hypothetical protein